VNLLQRFFLLPFVLLTLFAGQARASHIFGGELGYTHISGYTYELTLTLYGDCSGNAYPNLFSSSPRISVYDGQTAFSGLNLQPFGTAGVNVTPVCPAEVNNTKCTGGTLPGVAQFIFKGTVTLSGPSSNWRFVFEGNLSTGNNSFAGRSNAITNIIQGQNTTIMMLEATLNNSGGPNNCSVYSTIPTPFFCINIPQQYNQGALDPDGDDLSFQLVQAYDANGGFVNYQTGYSYLNPLAVSAGSFGFNGNTGQLSFQPNAVQSSLVVSQVVERRNGVVVGSSMREMTFVVLNNCSNQSPAGQIAGTNLGSVQGGNEIRVCNTGSTLQFNIQATDPDNQNVTATVNGLPGGANALISNNGSNNVNVQITWPIPANAPLGSTTFYITYQDDGCPLSSKQTIAYTVTVEQPIVASATPENVSCNATADGQITVNASSTNGLTSYSLNGQPFQSNPVFSGLPAGNYTVQVRDPLNCSVDLQVEVNNSTPPEITALTGKDISCYGKQDGKISMSASPAGNYTYTLLPFMISNPNGVFENLPEGNYTLVCADNRNCRDTAYQYIDEPPVLGFGTMKITDLTCNKANGKIQARSDSFPNALYILSPGLRSNSEGYFDNLNSGVYTVQIRTASDCFTDTVVSVGVEPLSFFISTTQQDLGCFGRGTEGSARVNTSGGVPPFSYLWSTTPPQTGPDALNLYYGRYTVSVTDATGCELRDTVEIASGTCCAEVFFPSAFTPNGDGLNDEWRMTTATGVDVEQFVVYNRWGQKVWQGYDQRRGWDGQQNGAPAEAGTYHFLLRYTCLNDGKKYVKKGDVIVVR
jgi:gliding motility-associated-like protein